MIGVYRMIGVYQMICISQVKGFSGMDYGI
jgi:hypothetical protein